VFLAEPEILSQCLGEIAVAPRFFHGINPHLTISVC